MHDAVSGYLDDLPVDDNVSAMIGHGGRHHHGGFSGFSGPYPFGYPVSYPVPIYYEEVDVDDLVGLDVLGADKVVAIDVDPIAVAKTQGAIAALAASAMPGTVTDQVYGELVKQISGALREKGITADVRVVDKSTLGKPALPSTEFRSIGIGVGVGVVGTVLGKLVWNLITKGRG